MAAGFCISLYFLITLCATQFVAFAQQVDHFTFNGFNGANLTLNGNAKIHPNGLLQLTNTSQMQIGHAFFPFPFHFNSSSSPLSFSSHFVFAIVPESPGVSGHGLAITISPSTDFQGAIATQYLGLFNSSNIGLSSNRLVAVEFDTVRNPEFQDIDDNHVGIDINNLTSIVSAPAAYYDGKIQPLDLSNGRPMQVWIDYEDGVKKRLNVTLAPFKATKPTRPLLSLEIDLSPYLLDSMYVGFPSSTGSISGFHYILGWSFSRGGQAESLLNLSRLPSLPQETSSSTKFLIKIILPLIIVVIILLVLGGFYFMRKRNKEVHEEWEEQYGPQRFSYNDLYRATKGFKEKEVLGFGGFGKVYKGTLPHSNVEVAVKKVSHNSQQGMKEFVAEISSMGRLRHRNLVHLLGYCRRKGELFLVYDYMPNGSLDKLLFNNEKSNLDWDKRFQIIKGIASALFYLHEEWEQVVVHRDVKASNVLLDGDFVGRLGDFGLAKFYDHGSISQTTNVVGTIGYLAPELTTTGKPTTTTDVFAFGIFMLEVACGRRPIKPGTETEEVILVNWVLDSWRKGDILRTIDSRLEKSYIAEETELVLKLGLLCAHPVPAFRPTMRQVLQYFHGTVPFPESMLHSASSSFYTARAVPAFAEISSVNSFSDTNSLLVNGR